MNRHKILYRTFDDPSDRQFWKMNMMFSFILKVFVFLGFVIFLQACDTLKGTKEVKNMPATKKYPWSNLLSRPWTCPYRTIQKQQPLPLGDSGVLTPGSGVSKVSFGHVSDTREERKKIPPIIAWEITRKPFKSTMTPRLFHTEGYWMFSGIVTILFVLRGPDNICPPYFTKTTSRKDRRFFQWPV